MGLRCLLGHDFGAVEVVREHEEDGNEMVVTEREVKRCQRCGDEQVLSESTEVRAIRSEADVRADDESSTSEAQTPSAESTGSVSDGAPDETPSFVDDETLSSPEEPSISPGVDATPGPDSEPEAETAESNTSLLERAEEGFDEPADPSEEDAVILDESEEKPEREHGAWPESDDVGPRGDVADTPETPATSDGEMGVDAPADDADDADADDVEDDAPRSLAETAAEEDAELLGAGDDEDDADEDDGSTVTRAGAPSPDEDSGSSTGWPEHDTEDEGFAAEQATAGGPEMAYGNEFTPSKNGASTGEYSTTYLESDVEERDGDGTIVSASTEGVDAARPGVETEYYCPNCGATRPLDSSLRSGDICPECQSGYLAERER